MAKKKQQTVYSFGSSLRRAREHAIGASFDEVLAPQSIPKDYTTDRIKRLITQCSQRDQELVLALIDQMLDSREEKQ